jgi:phosphate regulon transcriptional regulator PhoB
METRRILIVDDERDLVELLSYNLKKEGFSIEPAYNGEEALLKLKNNIFSLIILDLMLPGMDGLEVLRFIRSKKELSSLPVLMLTAKGEETDRVIGLEMGADDYVTKPFSPRELIARVKALLRRTARKPEEPHEGVLRLGDLEIDRERYAVRIKGKEVRLSATEFKLLLYLAERKGRVFTREQLLDAVWGDEVFVEPRTVDVHIRRLRAQIEDDPSNPRYIKTRRGAGYYFEDQGTNMLSPDNHNSYFRS